MLRRLTNRARRLLRPLRRAGDYALLLPHHRLTPQGLRTLGRPPEHVIRPVADALRLSDGTRTLSDVSRSAGVTKSALLELYDADKLLLWRAPVPGEAPVEPPAGGRPRSVIISPHPDDAALCLGGMMLSAGPGEVLVVNVFTRTAWSRFPGDLPTPADVERVRAAEEQCVARLTGQPVRMLGLPEAILRQHEIGRVFTDEPNAGDEEAVGNLRRHFGALVNAFTDVTWYLPLAVGNHVDHRLVRDVGLEILPTDRVRFYEDLPYAEAIGGVPNFSGAVPERQLRPESIDVAGVLRWKAELNRAYWSQLTAGQIARLRGYALRVGGGRGVERVWMNPMERYQGN